MRSRRACLARGSRGAGASSPAISALYATPRKRIGLLRLEGVNRVFTRRKRAPPGPSLSPPPDRGRLCPLYTRAPERRKLRRARNPPQGAEAAEAGGAGLI